MEELIVRVHGGCSLPALIYLPGLHGDWTLVGSFRRAVSGRVRFVELTYPRTLTWSLDEYAAGVERALARAAISEGWLLAESYGSQVAWQIIGRSQFQARGLILAGGFVRHPTLWGVRLAARLMERVPTALVGSLLQLYGVVLRVRYRRAPEVLGELSEFLGRRTELDRLAGGHRLRLIAASDPCDLAGNCNLPVYALTGFFDPVVAWLPVRSWLRKNCPALRQHKVIFRADHTVLSTAPEAAAAQVLQWIGA